MEELELPRDLVSAIQIRSNRNEESRFPYKLWRLLEWSDGNPTRAERVGCAWVDDTEFWIHKPKLHQTLGIRRNTLDVNLRHLGFAPTRRSTTAALTFYRNDRFSRKASHEDIERIRNVRCKSEALQHLDIRAVYLPILQSLQLFMMEATQMSQFKRDVIQEWQRLVNSKLVFGLGIGDFLVLLQGDLDANHPQGSAVRLNLAQALTPRNPNVCEIFDFALFLARFGPYRTIPDKLYQFQTVANDLKNDLYAFAWPSLPSHFSPTFHNCFRFQLSPTGEYHCYNLPLVDSKSQFLVDEDGAVYQSWHKMVHQNAFLKREFG
jgi:hypothetical protein